MAVDIQGSDLISSAAPFDVLSDYIKGRAHPATDFVASTRNTSRNVLQRPSTTHAIRGEQHFLLLTTLGLSFITAIASTSGHDHSRRFSPQACRSGLRGLPSQEGQVQRPKAMRSMHSLRGRV